MELKNITTNITNSKRVLIRQCPFLFGGKTMFIAFEIVLMIVMLLLTIGAIAEQKRDLRRDIQYILLIDTLILAVLFLFAN